MSQNRKRVRFVGVDFKNSVISQVQKFGSSVPQFFNEDMEPLLPVNQYMRIKSLGLASKSLQTTAEHINEFLRWLLNSNLNLIDVNDELLEYYIDALCSYKKPNGESLSWNTVNSRVGGAHRFLVWACAKGYCPDFNVADMGLVSSMAKYNYRSRSHPSTPMKEPVRFLTMETALKFVNTLGVVSGVNNPEVKQRNILIGAFMLQTGARISEACTFPLHDLPEVNTRLRLTPARLANGKGSKARVILIPNSLLIKLWEYVDINRESILERAKNATRYSVPSSLFLSEKGKEISPNWVQKLFRKAGSYSGIKVSPHILRHTFGTYHYLLNQDLEALATLMGHEQSSTTKTFYVGLATNISFADTYSSLQEKIDSEIEVSLNGE